MRSKTPDVEVYRRPIDGLWVAVCWIKGCRWSMVGAGAFEEEASVRRQARNHRRKHTREGDRG